MKGPICVGAVCGADVGFDQLFAKAPLSTRNGLKESLRFFLPSCHNETPMDNLLHH